MRLIVKRCVQAVFVVWAFPFALLCGFGRVAIVYELMAQWLALGPGFLGSYLRAAFYGMTLKDCSMDLVTGLGTYFSRTQVVVGPNVSVGSYCVIGACRIGARCQISSHVEIPGGRAQHTRNAQGRLSNTVESGRPALTIGEDCWIGAGAIVMASVGARTTVGAGSVVVRDLAADVVAVGAPAKARS